MTIVYTIVVIAAAVILLIAGVLIYTQIINTPLEDFLSSTFTGCGKGGQECCNNDWCNTGLICSGNICIENITVQIMIDESYLIYNDIETANMSQRNEYFSQRTGLGWEDCSNANNCKNCNKIFNFMNAVTCEDCSYCDLDTKNCKNCLACDSAENGKYGELYECNDCSSCENILYDLADRCSQCSFCNVANITTYENGLSCSKCFQCDSTKCYSCYDCESEDKTCEECDRSGSTTCNIRQDYELCNKVKECIAYYDGEPCEIEGILPLSWSSGNPFGASVSNILTNCINENVKNVIVENLSQKICSYDTSKINFIQNDYWFFFNSLLLRPYFVSDPSSYDIPTNLVDMLTSNNQYSGLTGETKGILFNDCGFKTTTEPFSPPNNEIIYHSDPEIFSSITTPRTPEGHKPVNLKIVVSNVSWNEQYGNDCSYNVYLCGQEAIATSEDDPILYLYRNFTYFNESDYTIQVNKWNFDYSLITGNYQVNVTGIRYPSLKLNLSGRNADVANIAKAFIAGLRDYFIFNSKLNQTVSFFCLNSGLYQDWESCYNNNVSVVINDRVPWNLTSFSSDIDTFSEVPNFKYIYYDSSKTSYSEDFEAELTFFAYTSNITYANTKNTIFISPVLVITPTIQCVNHNECSQVCSSLCPVGVYGCCFGCKIGQCQGGQCKCVDGSSYCSSSPTYQVGSACTRQCSSYTSSSVCTSAGCKWCPSYGGKSNGCGDSCSLWSFVGGVPACLDLCWNSGPSGECFTTAQCIDPISPTPTCTWTDSYVGWCWGCCSSTNTCTVPAANCY